MKKFLFLFAIGPVQSFIEQSRKAQDLYAGSKLLSELCKKGIDKSKEFDGDLIFPFKYDESIPNRFLVEFNSLKEDEAIKIGSEIENTVRNDYYGKVENLLREKFKLSEENNDFYIKMENQYKNQLSISWIFQEVYNDNYNEAYKKIESKNGALKNIRVFSQNIEQGRKCSICGERNVLFYRKNDSDPEKNIILKNKKFLWDANIYKDIDDSILQKGEGLCAVCIAKRNYAKFPSVSDIALYNIYDKINYKIDENPQDLDSQVIINLLEKKCVSNVERINNEEIVKEIKKKKLEYTPYYAVIIFDGDDMGKWMSGENIKDVNELKEFHKEFSKQLAEYAQNAKRIVDFPKGKAVYAGGDDFLGFLNLDYLFDTIKTLRSAYITKEDLNSNKSPTFSAGIAIVYHKTPLSVALNIARKMEKKAKKVDEKDAVGISILKNSGDIEEFSIKWYSKNESNIDLLKNILNIITKKIENEKSPKNQFSFNFVGVLLEEFNKLKDVQNDMDDIFKLEIKRTVLRSCNINDGLEKKNKSEELASEIIKLFGIFNQDISEFLNCLKSLMFLNRHQSISESEV